MHLPLFERLEEFIHGLYEKFAFELSGMVLLIAGAIVLFAALVVYPGGLAASLSIALFLSPLWVTLLVVSAAWKLWLMLRRWEFISAQEYVLLEIKTPRSIIKTPLAMETVLSTLHLTKGESNWYQKYFLGQVRPYWSLEIASTEGKVHFYIWTRTAFRRIVESAFYAQYPGAQLIEVDDYSRTISAQPHEWAVWGCDYKQTNKDPLPIKTYIEYGLDKVAEEPEQVDPLANLVEFMGSLGKGEHLWLQIIIRTHAGEKYGKIKDDGKPYTWKDEALDLVRSIRDETRSTFIDQQGNEQPGFPNPSKGQSEMMAAIERNVSKLGFDVGARSVYIADKAAFNPITITGMIGLFKQFSSETWNGIKATHWGMEFNDYPWEITLEKRKDVFRREVVDAYRRRQYYHAPHAFGDYMVMSTEEIATLFHIPSRAVESPSLPRIQSATATPPANLPT